MGFIRLALTPPRSARCRRASSPTVRARSSTARSPASRPADAGRNWSERVRPTLHRAAGGWRCAATSSRPSDRAGAARSPRCRRTVAGIPRRALVAGPQLSESARGGSTANAPAWWACRRGMIGQATLEATLGNIKTRQACGSTPATPVVLRRHPLQPPGGARSTALGQLPVRVSSDGRPSRSAPTARSAGSWGRWRSSATSCSARCTSSRRSRGGDLGNGGERPRSRAGEGPRTAHVKVDFVGEVQLMRKHLLRSRARAGAGGDGVFMIMASQFRSLRLPFIMLFHDSRVALVESSSRCGRGDRASRSPPHGHPSW